MLLHICVCNYLLKLINQILTLDRDCAIIHFKTKKINNDLNNYDSEITERAKLLGLVFDSTLKWKAHIEYIITPRLNKAIF